MENERKWPPTPIVSLSANTMSEGWAQASDAGFSHYCEKPVNFGDLGNILLELMDPSVPHKYLRDRPKPKALLKQLGLLSEEDDEEEDEEEDGN